MGTKHQHQAKRMLPGLLTVMVAIAGAGGYQATNSTLTFSCPKLNASHACICHGGNVSCDSLRVASLSFLASSAAAITALSACNNELRALPEDFFDGATNLTELILSDNRITSVEYSFFKPLTMLSYLDLSYNDLKTFHLPWNALPRLDILDMSHNYLTHLLIDENRQHHLDQLLISHNKIGNNLEFARNLTKLRLLSLGSNGITNITSRDFLCSTYLMSLSLNNNSLSDLSFLKCSIHLWKLNVSSNAISTISENVFAHLKHLSMLWIADNQLSEARFLHNIATGIQILDLSRNNLSSINPRHFINKTKLCYVDVSHNRLDNVYFAGNIVSLKTLLADDNIISDNNGNLFLTHRSRDSVINKISLSNNLISNITFISHLVNITILNLRNNKISNIAENTMSLLKNLKSLDLSNNKIKNVNFVRNIPFLRSLNLSNNLVTEVPCSKFLQDVQLDGNSITKLQFTCAPRLRNISMYGGFLRDRKEQELRTSKEVLLKTNNTNVTFPCFPTVDMILKCQNMCSLSDTERMVCEDPSSTSLFTNPVAISIFSICLPLFLLGFLFIFIKYCRWRRKRIYKDRQCLCAKHSHTNESLTTMELCV